MPIHQIWQLALDGEERAINMRTIYVNNDINGPYRPNIYYYFVKEAELEEAIRVKNTEVANSKITIRLHAVLET